MNIPSPTFYQYIVILETQVHNIATTALGSLKHYISNNLAKYHYFIADNYIEISKTLCAEIYIRFVNSRNGSSIETIVFSIH